MCHATERKTRHHLSYSGSLGSHFPTYQSDNIPPDLRYYVMLRLPKARLASFGCPYVHDTLHGFRFVSCCQLVKGVWKPSFHARRFPQGDGSPKPSYCKETVGSPRVPRLSLCTHALLSDPGGIPNTRHYHASGTAAFRVAAHRRRSLFNAPKGYPMTTTLQRFRALSHGLCACLAQLRTPVTGLTREPPYRPVGDTFVWWDFSVGVEAPTG